MGDSLLYVGCKLEVKLTRNKIKSRSVLHRMDFVKVSQVHIQFKTSRKLELTGMESDQRSFF